MTTPIHPKYGTIKGTEDQHADTLGHKPSDPFGEALRDKLEVDKNPNVSSRLRNYTDSVYNAETKKEMDRVEKARSKKKS